MALTDLTRISTSGIATGSTIDSPILRKDVDFRGNEVGVTSALFDSSERRLDFKDNVKLRFGDSADLNLFHNASDSVISHSAAGEGSLKILSGGAQSIECVKAGEVKVAHNGSTKIETTSTGVIVTGILTATSFGGGGGISAGVVTCTGLDLNGNGDVSGNFVIDGDLTVNGTTTTLDTVVTEVDKLEVAANNTTVGVAITQSGTGDIVNLFDGTTEVLTVKDGGFVGIGTLNPSSLLEVASDSPKISLTDTDNNSEIYLHNVGGAAVLNAANSDIVFQTPTKELVRIQSTGKVGINTTSPQDSAKFQNYTSTTRHQSFQSTNGDLAIVSDNNSNPVAYIKGTGTADLLNVFDNTSQVFTIKDGGNVLVGTTDSTIYNNGDSADEGIVLRNGEVIDIARKGDLQLTLNRQTNDGPHIGFYRSGGARSYISTRSNAFCIDVGGTTERLRITSDGKSIIQKDAGSTNNAYSIAAEFNAKTSGSAAANFGPALYLTSTFGGTTYAGTIIASQSNSDVHTSDLVFYPRNYSLFEGLRLASNGRVGIRTDNPGRELDVYKGTGNDCTIVARVKSAGAWFEANSETSSGYYGLKLRNGNTEKWFLGSYGSNNLQLKTATANASSLLEITSAGKIGINYSSPVSIIHALGNNTVGTSVTMTLQSHDTANATAGVNLLARRNDNVNETCKIQAASSGQNSVDLQFHTNSGEKLRIKSTGEVGINVTPSNGQMLAITGRSGYDDIVQVTADGSNMGARINLTNTGTGVARINATNNDLALQTGGNNRLFITDTGEVSLGNVDTSSSSALHIRSITSTETTLELSTKSNYNGSLPSAKISFTQQNGTEIARIKCDTNTGAANMADLTFWTNYGGLYERVRITKTGPVIIHSGSNAAGSLRIGGNYDSTGTTNATAKLGTLMMPHYTNAEEPIQMIRGYSDSTKTQISIGGGTSSANGATEIILNTSSSISGTASERLKIDTNGNTTITGDVQIDGSGTSIRIEPTDGLINFGMDGRSSLVTGTNSCYIFSGSGSSGDMPAGTLVLQSRSNVDRNILFATGSSAARKWHIKGSGSYGGRLQAYNSSNGNGQTFDFYRPITGALSTATSGTETTIITTNQIADAGAYVLILRSFEQAQTGGKLWSVRVVSSVFYIHSGSGNDGEQVTIPVTYSGHHNSGTSQSSNGQGPVTIKMHFYNGTAHTHGRITYTPNGFDYTGSNCDYYFYKLIDV